MSESKKVIDVSQHNGTINWAKVKGSCGAVIIRAGYRGYSGGKLVTDSQWAANIYGAEAQDIPAGVYWYTQAITADEAREEAAYCAKLLTGHQISYPVYLDLEYSSSKRTGRADDLSKTTRSKCARYWLDAVRAAGYTPGVYANENWCKNVLDLDALGDVDLWVAKYSSKAPSIGRTYSAWQYTSSGTVPGINHKTDISHWYVSYGGATTAAPKVGGFDMSTLSTIKKGSAGAEVKSVQSLLNGKADAGLRVDGICGSKTVAAIKAYQTAHSLSADGIVGRLTWGKLLTE